MDKQKEGKKIEEKKRSKKHTDTKLAIKGTFEQVIAAAFLKPTEKKAK